MARCFPFPPRGYERAAKADEPDFLKKEKQKEKKQKKEKRDKERKEGKEKHEKQRSDEKRREKKDKKEKHRDKKKDREKDRDNEKHKSGTFLPDEKRVVGPFGVHLPVPPDTRKKRENDRSAEFRNGETHLLSENPAVVENRIRATEQVSRNNHLVAERKNIPLAPETKSFRHAPELSQRTVDEERRTTNHLPDTNVVGIEGKKNNTVSKLGGNRAGPTFDGRIDGRGVIEEAKSSGSAPIPTSVGMVQIRVGGGVGRPTEKKVVQMVEGKEKIRPMEKPFHKDKDKDRETEKKKEENVKPTSETKHIDQSRMKGSSENHMLKSCLKDGNKKEFSSGHHNIGLQNDGNLRKRKDIGLNGIYDEHTTGPNKLPRKTAASTHPLTENGNFGPDYTQKPPMNIKVDGKGHTINGMVTHPGKHPSKSERKPDTPSKQPPPPPPHPDTRYLREVLSVPKMVDEWTDFDDQEWLFDSRRSQTAKPEVESCGTDMTPPQVWEKALWLDPVDVYALPYVIPH